MLRGRPNVPRSRDSQPTPGRGSSNYRGVFGFRAVCARRRYPRAMLLPGSEIGLFSYGPVAAGRGAIIFPDHTSVAAIVQRLPRDSCRLIGHALQMALPARVDTGSGDTALHAVVMHGPRKPVRRAGVAGIAERGQGLQSGRI